MGIEIVLNQHDLFAVGKVLIGQFLEDPGVIHGDVPIGHLDMPPALQRRPRHEQVGRAIALGLMVVPREASRPGLDRHARFCDELLRCLVLAHNRASRIVWPVINLQHIFHAGYEGGVGVWWNDPLLLKVGPENVIFGVRPIVLSLARSTMLSSTTADSGSFNVHRTRPFGGSEQARA
ncbi:MAG TPA: hypothetical protein VND19_23825, partial [Acetobacteraceae bacterium]|nr:hypothetical protein [Acetobacteraceae bacterium]